MKWTKERLATLRCEGGIYLRSENMTRLEVFSDTAFAFALTMLVVSVGSIPSNHGELILALKNVPAFFLSFAQIVAFWWVHRIWSQRYGLETVTATILTLAMIFVILVFVYPLRLIYSGLCQFASGGWLPGEFSVSSNREFADLFVIYGVGFAVITLIVTLLFWHAYQRRNDLGLTGFEVIKTQQMIAVFFTQVVFGVLSATFALLAPPPIGIYAGFVYIGLALVIPLVSVAYGNKAIRLATDEQTAAN